VAETTVRNSMFSFPAMVPSPQNRNVVSSSFPFALCFKHGVSPGYCPAFLFGRFVTTAARLVHSTVRSLFIPVPGQPTTCPPFNEKIHDWSELILTATLVNPSAAPFPQKTAEMFQQYGVVRIHHRRRISILLYAGGTSTQETNGMVPGSVKKAQVQEERDPAKLIPLSI